MVLEEVRQKIGIELGDFGDVIIQYAPKIIIAFLVLMLGIFVGKLVKWVLKKILVNGLKLDRILKYGSINVVLTIIKWVIYLVFVRLAVIQLEIPIFSEYLSTGLGVLQGLAGSIGILVMGYAIAVYARNLLKKVELESAWLLGEALFFFISYIVLFLAVRTAFVGYEVLANQVMVILTIFGALGITFYYCVEWYYSKVLKSQGLKDLGHNKHKRTSGQEGK